jgi:ketosteroid isomerase-like protein
VEKPSDDENKVKRHIQASLVLLAILLLIFNPYACREKTDKDLIHELMEELGRLAEKKDVEQIMNHLADDYSDFRGRGKEKSKEMLKSYFSHFRGIVIHMLGKRIVERDTSDAVVQTEMALSSGAARVLRKLIRISTDNYRLKMKLVKREGRWLIRYAEWRYVSLDELFPESVSILQEILRKK